MTKRLVTWQPPFLRRKYGATRSNPVTRHCTIFLLHLWLRLVPDQDAALRLLGTVWNLALIPATYGLSRALLGQGRLALTAAFLVAVSPFHILYSQELRMYTQVMLLALLGVWGYWQGRQTGGWCWWWLFGSAFLLALYTHYFAVWPLLAVGFHALLRIRDRQAWWRAVLVMGVLGVWGISRRQSPLPYLVGLTTHLTPLGQWTFTGIRLTLYELGGLANE